jgi:hypothetical protein
MTSYDVTKDIPFWVKSKFLKFLTVFAFIGPTKKYKHFAKNIL